MWHRGAAVAPTVTVAAPGRSLALPAGPNVLIVALDGTAEVAGVTLGRYDAVLLTDEEATLHATGHTAVLTLPPRA
jgi:redox-sensitive bicupin YhaK (pirin superfamily)